MRIRRLGWAGVEIEQDSTRLSIDYISTLGYFEEFLGEIENRDHLIQLERGSLDAALLTHLHRDHTDPEAVAAAIEPGAIVAGPERTRFLSEMHKYSIETIETELAGLGVERQMFSAGESLEIGPFKATACVSVDGTGAEQVAWLVSTGEESVLHIGDTVWHGRWWDIAAEYGSPDVLCAPANGVAVAFPFNTPAVDQPVDLTPEQAVDAAYALGAARLLPIHFTRTYEHDPIYKPVQNAEERLRTAAAGREVELIFPAIGEWIEVSAAKAIA
jgi:L-ascorbate metabolism protein UlaG (beta-lactamase superfamily)